MSITKSKLIALIELMQDEDAQSLLDYLSSRYTLTKKVSWEQIEEIEPDELDLDMIKNIENNPEEHQPFITHEQLKRTLGL